MVRKPEFHVDFNFWTFIYKSKDKHILVFHDNTINLS